MCDGSTDVGEHTAGSNQRLGVGRVQTVVPAQDLYPADLVLANRSDPLKLPENGDGWNVPAIALHECLEAGLCPLQRQDDRPTRIIQVIAILVPTRQDASDAVLPVGRLWGDRAFIESRPDSGDLLSVQARQERRPGHVGGSASQAVLAAGDLHIDLFAELYEFSVHDAVFEHHSYDGSQYAAGGRESVSLQIDFHY